MSESSFGPSVELADVDFPPSRETLAIMLRPTVFLIARQTFSWVLGPADGIRVRVFDSKGKLRLRVRGLSIESPNFI